MHVRNVRSTLVAAALLFTLGASCSSAGVSEPSTEVTTSIDTAATSGGSGGTEDDRTEIVDYLQGVAIQGGLVVDKDCLLDIVAQLSDADAKALADSARASETESPELSAGGEALGEQLPTCVIEPAATTTSG